MTPRNPRAKLFFDMVKIMRRNQRDYFATRNKQALDRSKNAEELVDSEIERTDKIIELTEQHIECDFTELSNTYLSYKMKTINDVIRYVNYKQLPQQN